MKKINIIIFLIFIFINITSFAQTNNKISYGIKAGANLTGRMFERGANTDTDRKLIFNFHVGGLVNIPLASNWKLQPEIQFLRAGFKATSLKENVKIDSVQRLSYITIPISFNYCFRDVNVKPYFSIGPYIGYALEGSIKSKKDVGGSVTRASRSINFKSDNLKRFDGGFMLGVGMDLDFFNLEFKYTQSILNQYDGNDNSIYSVNMNLGLSLIIFF